MMLIVLIILNITDITDVTNVTDVTLVTNVTDVTLPPLMMRIMGMGITRIDMIVFLFVNMMIMMGQFMFVFEVNDSMLSL